MKGSRCFTTATTVLCKLIILNFMLFVDAQLIVYPSGPLEVTEGQTVALFCQAIYSQAPFRMQWEYSQELEQRAHEEQVGDGNRTLIIKDIRTSDAGSFTCSVINPAYEHKSKTVRISVKKALNDGCGSQRFRCGNGHCIFVVYRCNNVRDCLDGSDEIGCDPYCTNGFLCTNGKCVDLASVCDQYNIDHCGDGSDEQCKDGKLLPTSVVTPRRFKNVDPSYVVMAGIFAVILIFLVLAIAVCRVRLRRAAQRPLPVIRHRHDSACSRDMYHQHNCPTARGGRIRNDSARSQEYRMPSSSSEYRHNLQPLNRPVAIMPNTVLELNTEVLELNTEVQYSPDTEAFFMPSPPPYSEIKDQDDAPPPYYSTEHLGVNSEPTESSPPSDVVTRETSSTSDHLRLHDGRVCEHERRINRHDENGQSHGQASDSAQSHGQARDSAQSHGQTGDSTENVNESDQLLADQGQGQEVDEDEISRLQPEGASGDES